MANSSQFPLRPAPRGLPSRRSRLRGVYRLLLVVAVLFVAVGLVFPLVFEPSVQLADPSRAGPSSTIQLLVANQNMTPITAVEYSCEHSKLIQANGAAANGAKVLIRGRISRISGRQAILEPCETAPVEGAPVEAAEFTVTISYRMYPWPSRRTSVFHVVAQVNQNGRVTGWKVT